eukprot:356187-Chlamydomonas_euryale.AAC.2
MGRSCLVTGCARWQPFPQRALGQPFPQRQAEAQISMGDNLPIGCQDPDRLPGFGSAAESRIGCREPDRLPGSRSAARSRIGCRDPDRLPGSGSAAGIRIGCRDPDRLPGSGSTAEIRIGCRDPDRLPGSGLAAGIRIRCGWPLGLLPLAAFHLLPQRGFGLRLRGLSAACFLRGASFEGLSKACPERPFCGLLRKGSSAPEAQGMPQTSTDGALTGR